MSSLGLQPGVGASDFMDMSWVGLDQGRDRVRTEFSDRNVVPGSTKYVDLGTYLTWLNLGEQTGR